MEKKLLISDDPKFNFLNKRLKKYYICELDLIYEFEQNKNELITRECGPFNSREYEEKVYIHIPNIMFNSLEDVSDIEKKIHLFDFSGNLSLDIFFKGKGFFRKKFYESRDLLMDKKDFYNINTLDEVEVCFLYYQPYISGHERYDSERRFLVLRYIRKNDDNRKKKSKTVVIPTGDLVTV